MGDISRFVESLSINPWLVLIAAVCTIVAVPLAFIFYLRSKKEKLPRYAVRSNNIIKGAKAVIPALTVHFQGHGEPIENLTVSKVVFWNAGRETIRKQDVVKPQGIVLKVKDGYKILHAEIIQRNASENNFDTTSSQDKTQATLTFEYIDRNEGVVIQIFHTGLKDEDIEVVGKIMAAGSPRRMFIPHPSLAPQKTPPKYTRKRDQVIGIGMIFFPFVITVLIRFLPLADPKAVPVHMTPTQWVIVLTVLFGLSWLFAYLALKPRVPRRLDLFYEDE